MANTRIHTCSRICLDEKHILEGYARAGTRWLRVGHITRPPSVVSYRARAGVVLRGDAPVKASRRYRRAPAYRSLQDAELKGCFLPARRKIERRFGMYPQFELSS